MSSEQLDGSLLVLVLGPAAIAGLIAAVVYWLRARGPRR